MELPIIHEDSEVVVVDKPSGVVVNRAETVREETVQDWMMEKMGAAWKADFAAPTDNSDAAYFLNRGGIVHRLDRETSGVLVLAKTLDAFTSLLVQFKNRTIQKEYSALTHGIWKTPFGEITAQVGRMRHNRKMMGVREDGRESVTEYRVERKYTHWEFPRDLHVDDRGYTGFSLVRFRPKTGRTHQIRVHARHMSHPLVGDFLYAGRKRSREDRKWAGRILLHAQRLVFVHPASGEEVVCESIAREFTGPLAYLLD